MMPPALAHGAVVALAVYPPHRAGGTHAQGLGRTPAFVERAAAAGEFTLP